MGSCAAPRGPGALRQPCYSICAKGLVDGGNMRKEMKNPPTLPSLCQGRAAPGTTLGVEQPTLAAPWPPCCPALLHLAAPLGAPSRPRKLFLRFRSCRLAPSNPCKVSQRLQARVTMQLAYPCWTVATLLPSRAAVWHPQTLARSRSRSKHVSECS